MEGKAQVVKVMRDIIGIVLVSALLLTLACIPRGSENEERRPTGGAKPATKVMIPADPGIFVSVSSSTLKKTEGMPLFNLEKVGGIIEGANALVEFSLQNNITFEGWAVDEKSRARAGGVNIVINSTHYPATYGFSRLDVADHFKVGDYAYSGFSCTIAASTLGKGRHTVKIHVIGKDGKTFQEGWPVHINVR
jgi:hypothetical protein